MKLEETLIMKVMKPRNSLDAKNVEFRESMDPSEKAAFEKANEKMHPVQDDWGYPILIPYGFSSDTKPQKGFVRSYTYTHPSGSKVSVVTGVNASYWESKNPSERGYWSSLEDYAKKVDKEHARN